MIKESSCLQLSSSGRISCATPQSPEHKTFFCIEPRAASQLQASLYALGGCLLCYSCETSRPILGTRCNRHLLLMSCPEQRGIYKLYMFPCADLCNYDNGRNKATVSCVVNTMKEDQMFARFWPSCEVSQVKTTCQGTIQASGTEWN